MAVRVFVGDAIGGMVGVVFWILMYAWFCLTEFFCFMIFLHIKLTFYITLFLHIFLLSFFRFPYFLVFFSFSQLKYIESLFDHIRSIGKRDAANSAAQESRWGYKGLSYHLHFPECHLYCEFIYIALAIKQPFFISVPADKISFPHFPCR